MKESAIQPEWIDVAVSIRQFHINKLKINEKWRIQDTAKALNRSYGSVNQYLMIASWLKTHEVQIRRVDTMKEAVELIKKLKRNLEIIE